MSGAGTLIPGLVARVAIGFALAFAVGTKGWRGKGGFEWFRQRQTYFPLILAGVGLSIFLIWLHLEQHGVVRSEPGFSFYVDAPPLFGLILFALGVLRSYRAAPTIPSQGVHKEALSRIAAYLESTAFRGTPVTSPSALRDRRQELVAMRDLARRAPPELPDRVRILVRLDSEIRDVSTALTALGRATGDA